MPVIIEPGNTPKPTDRFRGECRHCDSVIGFERRAMALIHDPRDGDYYCLPCPACPNDITIAADRLELYRDRPPLSTTGRGSE